MALERENRAMRSIATGHGFEVVETPDPDDWIGFVSYRLPLAGWRDPDLPGRVPASR